MRIDTRPRNATIRALAAAVGVLALGIAGAAFAAGYGGHGGGGGGHGGGGGGGHGGGGHPSASAHGYAHAPAGGYGHAPRGAYYAGHGGTTGGHGSYNGAHGGAYYNGHGAYYGGHGGYYGGHGHYYYGHGYYGAWYGGYWYPWGGVYGLGLYFATLPLYYQTLWWGGVPYYYADETFYRWNDTVGQYETVAPPEEAQGGAPPAAANEPYVYPRQGQSDQQLQQDRYQCYRWAADQTGFDPTRANGGGNAEAAAGQAGAYRRAESACLEGRGYTVR